MEGLKYTARELLGKETYITFNKNILYLFICFLFFVSGL